MPGSLPHKLDCLAQKEGVRNGSWQAMGQDRGGEANGRKGRIRGRAGVLEDRSG